MFLYLLPQEPYLGGKAAYKFWINKTNRSGLWYLFTHGHGSVNPCANRGLLTRSYLENLHAVPCAWLGGGEAELNLGGEMMSPKSLRETGLEGKDFLLSIKNSVVEQRTMSCLAIKRSVSLFSSIMLCATTSICQPQAQHISLYVT